MSKDERADEEVCFFDMESGFPEKWCHPLCDMCIEQGHLHAMGASEQLPRGDGCRRFRLARRSRRFVDLQQRQQLLQDQAGSHPRGNQNKRHGVRGLVLRVYRCPECHGWHMTQRRRWGKAV